LELLEDRTVLSPTLVADINQLPVDANPHNLISLDGELYLVANDGIHGEQLWKSDGTPDGTIMVTDINPGGQAGLSPGGFTVSNHKLFFSATDGMHGFELWQSDGTADGTAMVKDLNPGPGNSYPGGLTDVNGTLHFGANNGTTSRLYKTDGTAEGTVEMPGSYSDRFGDLTAVGSELYFWAHNPNGGDFFSSILWRTDGTTTQQIRNVESPGAFTAVGDGLYYSERNHTLYRTDQTGTVTLGTYAAAGVDFNGTYFFSDDISHALYKSDGTPSGTVKVAAFSSSPFDFVTVGNTLYFMAYDSSGLGLWKSDGTTSGTVRFASAATGGPSFAGSFTVSGNQLFFVGRAPSRVFSVWKSDGTTDGTVRVADIPQSTDLAATVSPMTAANGATYYVVDHASTDAFHDVTHNRKLWMTDGTADGTVVVPTLSFATLGSSPSTLINFDGLLCFAANDGVHGRQLYTTDGTADGTMALTDVPGGIVPQYLANVDGTLIFSAIGGFQGNQLWKSDGTPAGTTPIVGAPGGRFLTAFNGAVYYSSNQQLWKSDGTAAGTMALTDINTTDFNGFDPNGFTVFNNALYFSGNDGTHGYQLWKTDGTTTGTVMLTNVNTLGGLFPRLLTVVNGTLYFQAFNNFNGQLWKSDGTAAGTVPVANVYSSNVINLGRQFIDVNGTLYFTIDERLAGGSGYRLWKSDGTTSGTVPVALVPIIISLTSYQGTLYFAGADNGHGYQLWKSDGTATGTVRITNINPGGSAGFGFVGLAPMIVADGRLLFAGDDGVHGQELWVSDGTADGTTMVADINPGAPGSTPANLTVVDGVVYFTADDGTHGVELWKVGAVTAGVRLVVPPTATAGEPFTVTVQAINDFGGIDPNYRCTVHFASSDGMAALPDDYNFTADDAGSHTFIGQVTLFQAGVQALTVEDLQDAGLTDTGTILVQPGPVASFHLAVAGPVTAGEPFDVTVTAYDAFGNVATDYTGAVHFTSSDPQAVLPGDYTFTAADQGAHTFVATLKTAGSQSLAATDTLTSGVSGQAGVVVKPAAATHFSISGPVSVSSGSSFSLVVTALDAYGNVATGYTGTDHFEDSASGAKLPGNYTFTAANAGVHTFTGLKLRTRGTQTITVVDTLTGSILGTLTITVT
jgi:ELWxxDGT repeat protein